MGERIGEGKGVGRRGERGERGERGREGERREERGETGGNGRGGGRRGARESKGGRGKVVMGGGKLSLHVICQLCNLLSPGYHLQVTLIDYNNEEGRKTHVPDLLLVGGEGEVHGNGRLSGRFVWCCHWCGGGDRACSKRRGYQHYHSRQKIDTLWQCFHKGGYQVLLLPFWPNLLWCGHRNTLSSLIWSYLWFSSPPRLLPPLASSPSPLPSWGKHFNIEHNLRAGNV